MTVSFSTIAAAAAMVAALQMQTAHAQTFYFNSAGKSTATTTQTFSTASLAGLTYVSSTGLTNATALKIDNNAPHALEGIIQQYGNTPGGFNTNQFTFDDGTVHDYQNNSIHWVQPNATPTSTASYVDPDGSTAYSIDSFASGATWSFSSVFVIDNKASYNAANWYVEGKFYADDQVSLALNGVNAGMLTNDYRYDPVYKSVSINAANLQTGSNTITFTITNSGGGPSGAALYGRVLNGTLSTPEPGAFSLMALGLPVLPFLLRRRRRKSAAPNK